MHCVDVTWDNLFIPEDGVHKAVVMVLMQLVVRPVDLQRQVVRTQPIDTTAPFHAIQLADRQCQMFCANITFTFFFTQADGHAGLKDKGQVEQHVPTHLR